MTQALIRITERFMEQVLSEDRNLNPNSSYFLTASDGQDDYIDMGLDSSLQIQNSFNICFSLV